MNRRGYWRLAVGAIIGLALAPLIANSQTITGILSDAGQIVSGTLAVARGGTGVTTSTGSGSVVLSTSPTLVTPALGVAAATSINAGGGALIGSETVHGEGTDATTWATSIAGSFAFTPLPQEVVAKNAQTATTGSFSCFYAMAGQTSAGSQLSPGRYCAVRQAASAAYLAGGVRSGGTFYENYRFQDGHVNFAWALAQPALSSCGTSPTLSTGSTDTQGEVTTGTATPTSCTITFGTAYTNQPSCIVQDRSSLANLTSYTVSTSAIVLTTAAASSQKIAYHCLGN